MENKTYLKALQDARDIADKAWTDAIAEMKACWKNATLDQEAFERAVGKKEASRSITKQLDEMISKEYGF